jgi:hypothetical protein
VLPRCFMRWVDRCRAVIAESDSGAPELYAVIETLQGEYFDRLSTKYQLDGDRIVAESVKQTAN